MKIYTKKGDKGMTSLFGGSKVKKDNIRLHAYGGVDELNSYMGLINELLNGEFDIIIKNQIILFEIGSHLATPNSQENNKIPEINIEIIKELEDQIDIMNEELPSLDSFILPGGSVISAHCHIARCLCRRVERDVVSLSEKEKLNMDIIKYLNRLSDYLFVLARYVILKKGGAEKKWLP